MPMASSARTSHPSRLYLLSLALAAAAGHAADAHYTGTAYAKDSGAVVYREEHWLYSDNGTDKRLVLYRCPSGQAFARKLMQATGSASAPDFDYVDGRDGYREGVREEKGQREVFVQKNRQSSLKSEPLPAKDGAVIDAGFDAYVREHWAGLAGKQGMQVPFLVPSRFTYMNLRIDGASDSQSGGESVRHMRMSLDAWYGFAAPSIELTYTDGDHRLRRFEGISNVHDAQGRNQTVRIEFPPSDQGKPATRQEIDAAAALPLATHCPD
jgi:hypothetical protein